MMIAASCLILIVVLALQLSLGSAVAVLGVTPDLVFAAVCSLSALGDVWSGSLYGAGVGLLLDALFMTPGRYSTQYLLSGMVAGLLPVRGHKRRFFRLLMFCLPAYFAKESVQLLWLYVGGVSFDWPVFLAKIAVGAVYTAVCSILFYLVFESTVHRLHRSRTHSAMRGPHE